MSLLKKKMLFLLGLMTFCALFIFLVFVVYVPEGSLSKQQGIKQSLPLNYSIEQEVVGGVLTGSTYVRTTAYYGGYKTIFWKTFDIVEDEQANFEKKCEHYNLAAEAVFKLAKLQEYQCD